MLGSSRTIWSFWKMTVFAVPRSIAISCVRNENAIFLLAIFLVIKIGLKITKNLSNIPDKKSYFCQTFSTDWTALA
jgi:hypothetical protein